MSNKDNEDTEYSEERNTIIKTLMNFHFQNNAIGYTLKNILSIDEKIIESNKYGVRIKIWKMGLISINSVAVSVECI